uniref:Uncharacterized protein n=1 Tax=Clytia hemisphaerica TaxID=252671 RepID=A0A7M5V7L6_9CNID
MKPGELSIPCSNTCIKLPITKGCKYWCGVDQLWESDMNKKAWLGVIIAIPFIAFIISLVVFFFNYNRKLIEVYLNTTHNCNDDKERCCECCDDGDCCCCCCGCCLNCDKRCDSCLNWCKDCCSNNSLCCSTKCGNYNCVEMKHFVGYILGIVTYWWFLIDMIGDFYAFYTYEFGDLVHLEGSHQSLHRNSHVTKSAFAFGIVGYICKMIAICSFYRTWKFTGRDERYARRGGRTAIWNPVIP